MIWCDVTQTTSHTCTQIALLVGTRKARNGILDAHDQERVADLVPDAALALCLLLQQPFEQDAAIGWSSTCKAGTERGRTKSRGSKVCYEQQWTSMHLYFLSIIWYNCLVFRDWYILISVQTGHYSIEFLYDAQDIVSVLYVMHTCISATCSERSDY